MLAQDPGPGGLAVSALTKRFGKTVAIDHLDFDISTGQILALLGPGISTQAQRQWFTASSAYLGGRRPIDELAAGHVDRARGAAAAYAGGDPT